ncbi:signal peptidase complex subunit 3-like [Saccoglossus kowalevskii]|uniref:Signal peptidase complex subunit 3 n=1 Tax=Saccoglossus kowalevskii TaxID=10224 RepID=A0ABM0GTF7_SACKO|nr:PREDICTED: signal peptidase complex subunit 3-like [Saccoglossus kowalevskii]
MNTFLSRLNTIFAFTLSVMAALTFGCFLSTAFKENKTAVDIGTTKAVVKNVPNFAASTRDRNDLGQIAFDLHTELSSLFNWNTKQLFLYLTAEYETKSNKLNQVVLWDKIIRRGETTKLDFKSMNTKYYFFDDGNGLKGNQNVTLTLSWNVIPNAGTLPRIQGEGSYIIQFPDEYKQ